VSLFNFMFHSIYDQASLAVMALGLAGHAVADFMKARRDKV
jgi:hypothetical protein